MYPLLRGPCRGSPSESHLQAPGPTLRAPGFGEQPPAVDTRAEDGRGLRSGSCRLLEGRAAAGKRGGGKEGAGAVWAAGVFPAPHRRGRIKNLPATQENQVQFLGLEDPLEKEVATHSSILTWRISWTEEPGQLSIGSQESDPT